MKQGVKSVRSEALGREPVALPALRGRYPGLDVQLITTDQVLNLARMEGDIGIRNVRPTQQSLAVRKGGQIAVQAFQWANRLSCPVAFRATDAVSMMDAIAADLGIGVLPCFIADGNEELVCLDGVGAPQPEIIWLAFRPEAREIKRMRIVLDWLVELFRENSDLLARKGFPRFRESGSLV